ncbi:RluA family pseudouridine synthase [Alkaliphilus peptidifermentans]|uniref:Pseudouridine synthase n=1 Tax=Alkaliphilus peptidifermentans DSM 18978 TaxID=1120976 RepID=A0A1G5CMJ3_9FIRM|nr:RluA family pseudouridine synthase [Alkaliphilus peptidifermentans]SCY03470.1 23S rRNA pseudouridine1911/1915/1917 synthase [Alkaliphilus peptidifermentans DSM 18978]
MLIKDLQTETLMVYQAEEDDEGKPIKQILKNKMDFSSRLLTKLKKEKNILINNSYAKYHEIVKDKDIITIDMEEPENQFIPQDIPFSIVYEDVDVIIINKQPGIVSHPTKSHSKYTIANAAAYYLQKQGKKCRIRFANRLDMDTSGLLIIAKNPYAHHVISQMMAEDRIQKKYITFVEGLVNNDEGIIEEPIYRPTDDSIRRIVDNRGQYSLTKYKVINRFKNATMLEVELLTGRTHQIRVHLHHLGHPIIGDTLYGEEAGQMIERQALHAAYLKLYQPRYKNQLEVVAELPMDLKELQRRLSTI